jgi:hypothetical protein
MTQKSLEERAAVTESFRSIIVPRMCDSMLISRCQIRHDLGFQPLASAFPDGFSLHSTSLGRFQRYDCRVSVFPKRGRKKTENRNVGCVLKRFKIYVFLTEPTLRFSVFLRDLLGKTLTRQS